MEIEKIKSSKKLAKLARKYYRREMRAAALKTGSEIGEMIGNNLKPKPKFIPMFIWLKIVGMVIKIKKSNN